MQIYSVVHRFIVITYNKIPTLLMSMHSDPNETNMYFWKISEELSAGRLSDILNLEIAL